MLPLMQFINAMQMQITNNAKNEKQKVAGRGGDTAVLEIWHWVCMKVLGHLIEAPTYDPVEGYASQVSKCSQ